MKRVLVTGASGFVGRHALPALVNRGYDVHAVAFRGATDAAATWHTADLMRAADRERLLDEVRPTHLLHFAWYAVHGLYWTSIENLRWVEASLALLREFAATGGRRAVLAGTCAEYDWRHGFCSERVTPTASATLYGASKVGLSTVATAFAAQAGLDLAWGRIFFPFGPGEPSTRLVPSVIRSLLDGQRVRCSHGRQLRDFLYVGDCADAFASLLDSDVRGAVNVGSGCPTAIRDLVRAIADRIPGVRDVPIDFGAVVAPPDEPPLLVADVRRLTDEVRWAPSLNLDEAIDRTVAWWRAAASETRPIAARG